MIRRLTFTAAALLLAVGLLAGCSKSDDAATSTPTAAHARKAKLALRFAPVLGSSACGAPTTTRSKTDTTPTTPTTQFIPQPGGLNCWRLGDDGGNGNDLTSAKVVDTVDGGGSAAVQVTVLPRARQRMNDMFNSCFHDTPSCPTQFEKHGSVAIILDDVVRSTPAIQAANLANHPIQIVGLTNREAESLAELINS